MAADFYGLGKQEADPVRERALLERHLGQVVMTPKVEAPSTFGRCREPST